MGFAWRRLVHAVVVLILVSLALTALLNLAPGDPAFVILGDSATSEQIEQVHRDLHLDEPFHERYRSWASGVVQGDLGESYISKRPVLTLILDRLQVTVELVLLAIVLALLISIPIGVFTAYRSDSWLDRGWTLTASGLIAFPPFISGLVLVYLLALYWSVLPATGWVPISDGLGENLRHVALPVMTLALAEVPAFSRLLRADMVTTLQSDYILAARARGLSDRRVLIAHALRPSSLSLVTFTGLSVARLLGGAVVVESLFALPGLGQLIVQSIYAKDFVVVQGMAMFIAIVYVGLNSLVDLTYHVLDPRVRTTGG